MEITLKAIEPADDPPVPLRGHAGKTFSNYYQNYLLGTLYFMN